MAFIVQTLRGDGHAVFHAYDVLAATQLAFTLEPCDLVISKHGFIGDSLHSSNPEVLCRAT